jgi:hypothetical protein
MDPILSKILPINILVSSNISLVPFSEIKGNKEFKVFKLS